MRLGTAAIVMLLAGLLARPAAAQDDGFTAGTGLLFLRPYFSDNPAYVRTASDPTSSFNWQFERAHSAWAGYTLPSGWGVRFEAFLIDGDSSRPSLELNTINAGAATPATAGPFGVIAPSPVLRAGLGEDQLWFRSRLRVLSTEYEGTYAWWQDDWSVRLSAGLRYQLIGQRYIADLSNEGDGRTIMNVTMRNSREFVGLGPTLRLFGRYRIDGPWSAYGGIRGAIVFGTEDRQSVFSGALAERDGVVGTGSGRTWASSRRRVERVVPVTQLDVGIEYATDLGPLRVILRSGVVAHSYFDGGGAAGGGGTVNLLGGQVSLGLSY